MKIWVYAESEGDKPTTATLELVTKARELGDVECVYVGPEAATVAPALGEYGAAKVFVVDAGECLAGVVGAAAVAQLAGRALARPRSCSRRATTAATRSPACR